MPFASTIRAMVLLSCAGQVLAGCGLGQNEPPDQLSFALPVKTLALPSQQQAFPSVEVPNMVCAGPEAVGSDCCMPPTATVPIDCRTYPVACNPADNMCALIFDMNTHAEVNLTEVVQAAGAVQGRVFARVLLSRLTTEVTGAEQLPVLSADLYLGPAGSPSPSSPGVALLGQVALAPGNNQVALDAAAEDAFSGFARDYGTAFDLILSAHFVFESKPPRTGALTVEVSGQATAYY